MIPLVAQVNPLVAVSIAFNLFSLFIYIIVLVPMQKNIKEIYGVLNGVSVELSGMKGYTAGQKDTYEKVDTLLKDAIAGSKK